MIPLDVPDVLPNLEKGVVDAFGNSPYGASALQWDTKVAYMTELKQSMVIGGTVIGKDKWDSLPVEFQVILRSVSDAAHKSLRARIRKDNHEALWKLEDKGIEVVSPENLGAWQSAADKVRGNLTGSLFDKALVDKMMGLL